MAHQAAILDPISIQPARQELMRFTYAVWELTLKCNLACRHCGSRAGEAREAELNTAEALDLVTQLAEAGIGELTLIGGEAYLRPDWLTIVSAVKAAGIRCTVTTGGYGISHDTARRMREAGLEQVSVSVDGLTGTHDFLRGREGSWNACFRTFEHLRSVGIGVTANTQINRLSAPELPSLYEQLREAGVFAWQLQMTVPMGRAADHAEILLQPFELLNVFPVLADLAIRGAQEGVRLFAGNNVGYYGPYERLLRGGGEPDSFWTGCQAGLRTIGIEADGTIKGCPSLPTTAYAGGNIRKTRLHELVNSAPEMQFNADAGTPAALNALWGFCRTCDYAELCRGGCSWTAHVFFGRRGNNPYCHHRALTLARSNRRERIQRVQCAPGDPFDHGYFELIEESLDAPQPVPAFTILGG